MITIPFNIYEKIINTNFIPDTTRIMRAFNYFPLKETKVIILGQDTYPNREDACGLAFSVEHNRIPGSLKNIFKELQSDVKCELPKTGNLESWAKQGVLLLNTILTTEPGKVLAHKDIGWQEYTKVKLQEIMNYKTPVVIIAWGNYAQDVVNSLKLHDKVLVLKGKHPSPINKRGGFLGGKYFSKANEFLKKNKIKEIDWRLG